MSDPQARLGSDLRLLANLARQNDRNGGSDLTLAFGPGGGDLATVRDSDNLAQALMLRLLTRQGDLAQLGHPAYGARLYTLIGELNNDTTRNLAKLFVLEAIGAEPRVGGVVSISVTQGARDRIDIAMVLRIIGSDTPLNLVFPFFLDPSFLGAAA